MTKKIKIIIAIVCVILLGIGFTILDAYRYEKSLGGIPIKEYNFKIIGDQKLIENKKIGFSFQIPADWIEDQKGVEEGSMLTFASPDVSLQEGKPVPATGCLFMVDVVNYDKRDPSNTAQLIQNKIKSIKEAPSQFEDSPFQILNINGVDAYEEIYYRMADNENGIEAHLYRRVELPQVELARVYLFEGFSSGDDIEKCQQEFDQILATVKINERK
jgi:hypothetical protein